MIWLVEYSPTMEMFFFNNCFDLVRTLHQLGSFLSRRAVPQKALSCCSMAKLGTFRFSASCTIAPLLSSRWRRAASACPPASSPPSPIPYRTWRTGRIYGPAHELAEHRPRWLESISIAIASNPTLHSAGEIMEELEPSGQY
jgi:hypothetical protein